MLVKFPRENGFAAYAVTVGPAEHDPALWDLGGAIERYIAESPFPRIQALVGKPYFLRASPGGDNGNRAVFDTPGWAPTSEPLPCMLTFHVAPDSPTLFYKGERWQWTQVVSEK